MIYFLLAVVTVLLIISYKLSPLHFMSPTFYVCVSFFISVVCCVFEAHRWNTDISAITVAVIAGSILLFLVGELIGQGAIIRFTGIELAGYEMDGKSIIVIGRNALILINVFSIVINVAYFRYVYDVSVKAGNRYGISKMFSFARMAFNYLKLDNGVPILLSQGILITKCIAHVLVFVFLYNVMNRGFKRSYLYYLLPAVSLLINVMLSTARIDFMYFLIYVYLIFLTLFVRKKNKDTRFSSQYIKLINFIIGLLVALFLTFGLTTGKTQYLGAWNSMMLYGGGSIIAFDSFLQNRPERAFIGKETLRLFFSFVGRLGIDVPKYDNSFLEFTYIGPGIRTNVYSALRRYLQDFGTIGTIIILLVLGMIFGSMFKKLIYGEKVGIAQVIIATFAFPVFLFSIDEFAIRRNVSISTIYQLFYFYLIQWLIGRERKT